MIASWIKKNGVLKELKCAARPRSVRLSFCQRPLTRPASHGSLANNQLCGLTPWGSGTYTAKGITKLCEALKGSAVTSLKCATSPSVCFCVSAR